MNRYLSSVSLGIIYILHLLFPCNKGNVEMIKFECPVNLKIYNRIFATLLSLKLCYATMSISVEEFGVVGAKLPRVSSSGRAC